MEDQAEDQVEEMNINIRWINLEATILEEFRKMAMMSQEIVAEHTHQDKARLLENTEEQV